MVLLSTDGLLSLLLGGLLPQILLGFIISNYKFNSKLIISLLTINIIKHKYQLFPMLKLRFKKFELSKLINKSYKVQDQLIMFTPNKFASPRYSSQIDYYSRSSKYSLPKNQIKTRNSHAVTSLVQKQTQIDLVKKRISALCLRDQKYTKRTLNTELQMQKKQAIKKQSLRIQQLLEKQRKQESQKTNLMKHRNLQSRADNYFRARNIRERRQLEAKQKSNVIRNKSKQYTTTIVQHRTENIENNINKSRAIHEKQLSSKQERSRILSLKREEIIQRQKRQSQHIERLEGIKDHQLTQLGKLQLMMLQKSNTSRAVYEASKKQDLRSSKYSTHKVIKTAREFNPEKINISFNMY